MKNKPLIFLLLIFGLLLNLNLSAQSAQTTFAYQLQDSAFIYNSIELAGGGYVGVGIRLHPRHDHKGQLSLFYFDAVGNLLRTRCYGDGQLGFAKGMSIAQNSQGNLIFTCNDLIRDSVQVGNYTRTARLMVTTADGTPLRDVRIGKVDGENVSEMFLTQNEDIVMVGISKKVGGYMGPQSHWIARFTPQGTPIWSHLLGNSTIAKGTWAGTEMTNGDLLIAGSDSSYAMLARLDPQGKPRWVKRYGNSSGRTNFRKVIQASDGFLYLTGSTTIHHPTTWIKDSFLAKTDTSGNLLGGYIYSRGTGQNDDGEELLELPNGNMLVIGSGEFFGTGSAYANRVFILEIDSLGWLVDARDYGDRGEIFPVLRTTSDGGYLLSSVRFKPWQGYKHPNGWLMKLDANRDPGCFSTSRTHQYTEINFLVQTLTRNYWLKPALEIVDTLEIDSAITTGSLECSQIVNRDVDLSDLGEISIYPNPAKDYVTIRLPAHLQTAQGSLTLYNLLGQEVRQFPFSLKGNQELRLSLTGISEGPYLLRLTTGQGTYSHKLLVRP